MSKLNQASLPALGIEVEINFVSKANKIDCNVKPDPKGNAQIQILTNSTKRFFHNK